MLADGWYSWVGPRFTALTTLVDGRPFAAAVLARGPLRGLALGLASFRYDAVALIRYDPGWRSLLAVRALLGTRRKLVVLQFFEHAEPSWFERWALRRSVAAIHVLTEAELRAYPAAYGIDPRRFALIRFAGRWSPVGAAGPAGPSPRVGPVLATGRAHCDWETLLAAAAGRGWDLVVVTAGEHRAAVEALNARYGAGARVHSDLSHEEVQAMLARARVAVIPLLDGLTGRGHVRVCDATEYGAAIVASDVRSLDGYLSDGVTARLVPPGDADALCVAVETLLTDAEERSRLAAAAWAAAESWTAPDYVAALEALAAAAAS